MSKIIGDIVSFIIKKSENICTNRYNFVKTPPNKIGILCTTLKLVLGAFSIKLQNKQLKMPENMALAISQTIVLCHVLNLFKNVVLINRLLSRLTDDAFYGF